MLPSALPRDHGEWLGCRVRQRLEEPFAPRSVRATSCQPPTASRMPRPYFASLCSSTTLILLSFPRLVGLPGLDYGGIMILRIILIGALALAFAGTGSRSHADAAANVYCPARTVAWV
jgi:hypothetical protein